MSIRHISKALASLRTVNVSALDPRVGENPAATDPHWASVVLAMRMNGTHGSTTITDEKSHAISVYGNAQIKRSMGGGWLYLDGSGDYVQTTAASSDFYYGADFTMEGWFHLNSVTSGAILINNYVDGDNDNRIFFNGSTLSWWIYHTGGYKVQISASASPVAAEDFHVAAVRSVNSHLLFLNGAQVGSASVSHTIPNTTYKAAVGVSAVGSALMNGFAGNVRITKGVARYTGAFTPPLCPFPNS